MQMIAQAIHIIFTAFSLMIFVRILSSWIPEIQGQKWLQFIAFYVDPYLNLFRKIIPPLGMLDISPILAFFALQLAESVVMRMIS